MTTPSTTRANDALAAIRRGIGNVRATLPRAGGGDPILRLLKDGQWVFGADDHPIKGGTEAAVNILSIQHGFCCWSQDSELLGERMVPLGQPAPAPDDLPDTGHPWKPQLALTLRFISGAYSGQQVRYKPSSDGGLRAAGALLDVIEARLAEDTPYVCPIIALSSDTRRSARWGRYYVPVLEVVGWMDLDGNEEGVEAPSPPARARAAASAEDETPRRSLRDAPPVEFDGGDDEGGAPVQEPIRRRRR